MNNELIELTRKSKNYLAVMCWIFIIQSIAGAIASSVLITALLKFN